jgi:regulator of replication initiation timing
LQNDNTKIQAENEQLRKELVQAKETAKKEPEG